MSDQTIAGTKSPPYYAVIFTSLKAEDDPGYAEMSERMHALASMQPGFLGVESARSGIGITVSYWESEEAIKQWKENAEHRIAQEKGISKWYSAYRIRVARVEREYGFSR